MVQVFPHGNRLALVANNVIVAILLLHQTEHLLGPKSELSGLNCGALGIAQNGADVFVAFLGNESLVSFLGGKREDVFVQKVLEFGGSGETFHVLWLFIKLVAQLRCRCRHEVLLLFWT